MSKTLIKSNLENQPKLENQENQLEKIYRSFENYDARYALANILAGESIGIVPTFNIDNPSKDQKSNLANKFQKVGRLLATAVEGVGNTGNWASRYLSDRFLTVGWMKESLNSKGGDIESALGGAGLGSAKQMTALYADLMSSQNLSVKDIVEGNNVEGQVEDYLMKTIQEIGGGLLITGKRLKSSQLFRS
ncbi:hypothetical protein HC864_03160 [Candidatus Gracilibacteria bacterium]|nr:hypothetical protein [Candidatus Gracilibacteria bacterium]